MTPLLTRARWMLPLALGALLWQGGAPAAATGEGADCRGEAATIVGTARDDVLLGTRGDDVIVGLGGNDVIRGRAGNDLICGGRGDDLIAGGAGSDVIAGGGGTDTASYAGAPSAVVVDLATGGAEGGFGIDRLDGIENVVGSFWADTLRGDATANRLRGGPGNDVLVGGAGDDVLAGDQGMDTADYEQAEGPVTVVLRESRSSGAAGVDRLTGIESLVGSPHDDFLSGSGAANVIDGAGGDDVIRGHAGPDALSGGSGFDVTVGGPGVDACEGEARRGCDPSDPGDSKNCSDFQSQPHAQTWFDAFYPSYGDVARLDADGNGMACEGLGG